MATRVFVQVDSRDNDFFEQEWPAEWRIPVAGEMLLIGARQLTVSAVQWELEQDDFGPSVQLRCLDA